MAIGWCIKANNLVTTDWFNVKIIFIQQTVIVIQAETIPIIFVLHTYYRTHFFSFWLQHFGVTSYGLT